MPYIYPHGLRVIAPPPIEPPASGLIASYDAGNAIVSDEIVLSWPDESGSGNDLNGVNNPSYLLTAANGLPAIHCLSGYMANAGPLVNFSGANVNRTMAAVVRFISGSYAGFGYGAAGDNKSFSLTVYPNNEIALQGGNGSAGNDSQSGVTLATDEWAVLSVVLENGTATVYRNETLIDTFVHDFDTALTEVLIGKEFGFENSVELMISKFFVYDNALSGVDLSTLQSSLIAEYSIVADTTSPVLSAANATTLSSVTASGDVTSANDSDGTLYYLVSENATPPSAAQMKQGLDQGGQPGVVGSTGSQKVFGDGAQPTISFTGLTADVAYYAYFLHTDIAGNDSNIPPAPFTTDNPSDGTPPTLTVPTGQKEGSFSGSGTVVTNEDNGDLYYWATTNSTETQAAILANNVKKSVTATGEQGVTFSGLSANTTYYAHYVHKDAAGNDSTEVHSGSWVTDVAGNFTPLWTSYFQNGTQGQFHGNNAGAPDGDAFEYVYESNSASHYYDNTAPSPIPFSTHAARIGMNTGSESQGGIWGTDFGDSPTKVYNGGEMWVRSYIYIPSDFHWHADRKDSTGESPTTDPNWRKFQRVGHSAGGFLDLAIASSSIPTVGPQRLILQNVEVRDRWTSGPNGNGTNQNRYSTLTVPVDEWVNIEWYIKASNDPNIGRMKIYINGVLAIDCFKATNGDEGTVTLANSSANINTARYQTYWNNGAPKTQHYWLAGLALTTNDNPPIQQGSDNGLIIGTSA